MGFGVQGLPQGSNDPNNRVLGPKYYNINGIWALKTYYLAPWTLRVRVQGGPRVYGLRFRGLGVRWAIRFGGYIGVYRGILGYIRFRV